ncbi:hypothetical protein [Paraburkholderia tropica]|uniref:hypothetical protein n=1 Tax=Paraburkholderia tropica TaxID=92647 RepID=UPI002AB15B55|nr:hypothetical protein [Paraburkholderia tropica]
MAGNPKVAQGGLNKVMASVVFTDNADLNVTASNLGKAGVSLALQGNMAELIGTMSGTVTSPEPYVQAELVINVLRTQGVADVYKQQWEDNAVIGDLTVTPDSTTLSKFPLVNCAIMTVQELAFAGADPVMQVRIQGSYEVNNSLWSAV